MYAGSSCSDTQIMETGPGYRITLRNIAWAGRHGVRKASAHLKLSFAGGVKSRSRTSLATLVVKG